MFVKFKTVRNSPFEQYKKDIEREKFGENSQDYHNTEDFFGSVCVDMERVVGYMSTTIYYNGETIPCVYAQFEEDYWSYALCVTSAEFDKILSKTRNVEVIKYTDILSEIK